MTITTVTQQKQNTRPPTNQETTKFNLKALEDFPFFLEYCWTPFIELKYNSQTTPKHQLKWAKEIQDAMEKQFHISLKEPRNHLKSSTLYALVAWVAFRATKNIDIIYMSNTYGQALTHLRNIKDIINRNGFFENWGIKDISDSQHKIVLMKETIDGVAKITIDCLGFLSSKRGGRYALIICDDILKDEENSRKEPVSKEKIDMIFKKVVMPMPTIDLSTGERGMIVLAGTPQFEDDLFSTLQVDYPDRFVAHANPAVINWKTQEVLWPEGRPFSELMKERGTKESSWRIFESEYQLIPQSLADSFIPRADLEKCLYQSMNPTYGKTKDIRNNIVFAGYDLGKIVHPSHLAVFEYWEETTEDNKVIKRVRMIINKFYRNVLYVDQLQDIRDLISRYSIDHVYFDNTRGDLTMDIETNNLPPGFREMKFTRNSHDNLSRAFAEVMGSDDYKFELIDDRELVSSILAVNLKLETATNKVGHGDAFWSIAMGLSGFLTDIVPSMDIDRTIGFV